MKYIFSLLAAWEGGSGISTLKTWRGSRAVRGVFRGLRKAALGQPVRGGQVGFRPALGRPLEPLPQYQGVEVEKPGRDKNHRAVAGIKRRRAVGVEG
mgnify:CR=1 FL=1